jgi:hypothetical protein
MQLSRHTRYSIAQEIIYICYYTSRYNAIVSISLTTVGERTLTFIHYNNLVEKAHISLVKAITYTKTQVQSGGGACVCACVRVCVCVWVGTPESYLIPE